TPNVVMECVFHHLVVKNWCPIVAEVRVDARLRPELQLRNSESYATINREGETNGQNNCVHIWIDGWDMGGAPDAAAPAVCATCVGPGACGSASQQSRPTHRN